MVKETDNRLAAAYVYHTGKWPIELISGVMYFDGLRITKEDFRKYGNKSRITKRNYELY